MKIVLGAVAASLGLSGAAMAQEGERYQMVAVSGDMIGFVDAESLSSDYPAKASAWLLRISNKPKESGKAKFDFDCSKRTSYLRYLVNYDKDRNIVDSQTANDELPWIPGSMIESAGEFVCFGKLPKGFSLKLISESLAYKVSQD